MTASFGSLNKETMVFTRHWCSVHKEDHSIHFQKVPKLVGGGDGDGDGEDVFG